MLEPILGSLVREQVLLYIHARGDGYAREISRFFKAPLDSVQKQLKRLESGNILNSVREGRTLIYKFNEEYDYLHELRVLLEGVIGSCSYSFGREDTTPKRKNKRRKTENSVIVRIYRMNR
ncbi:MAG: winged helix-turn-helix domain-containing protein [Candidatus Aegiribacteria sp.]|nr:winged helix-turn-helix domain-containing protein [Candidatus Aegiribacteria sp.]